MSEENIKKWEGVFSEGRAHQFPDLTLVHLINRYALKDRPVKRALSVGAGNGNNEFMLAQAGIHVTCTDGSESAVKTSLKIAKERGLERNFEAHAMPMHDLSRFQDESFDLVLHWGALHYERAQRGYQSLQECHRVLKKGFCLVGEVDSTFSSGFRHTERQVEPGTFLTAPGCVEWRPGIEVHPYSREELENNLKRFSSYQLGHRTEGYLNRLDVQIAQWFFVAVK